MIRPGKREDLPQVLELIRELALFEKAPEEVINTLERMEEDGFGKNPCYRLLVAEMEGAIQGMALYFIKYSTWKGKGIYLDDLVVREKYRGRGIGRQLFEAVLAKAKKEGARQLHWQVLDWNEPAIRFYRKYNANFDSEWIDCKLNEEQIHNFVPDNRI
jgi:GNAT superfamily N-acetyltransferase